MCGVYMSVPEDIVEIKANVSNVLDEFSTEMPTEDAALKLFHGEWSTSIPGFGHGYADLFNRARIDFFRGQIGTFVGKDVLELGPLEAAQTYLMATEGANVLAVESNKRAFLRCLLIQNLFQFRAKFTLGDFRPYLATTDKRFDFILAAGVLYHMTEPLKLIEDMCRASDTVGVWTHFYDANRLVRDEKLSGNFDHEPTEVEWHGRTMRQHRQSYNEMLTWSGFSGGTAPVSAWLTRDSLLGAFDMLGFDVTIDHELYDFPAGPCILLCAKRRK
jgi:SAM-dependent methyltransferase